MIVKQSAMPVRRWPSASHQPARRNHSTFPTVLSVSWRVGLACFGILGTVAVAAALYPASRAAGTDPIEAVTRRAGVRKEQVPALVDALRG